MRIALGPSVESRGVDAPMRVGRSTVALVALILLAPAVSSLAQSGSGASIRFPPDSGDSALQETLYNLWHEWRDSLRDGTPDEAQGRQEQIVQLLSEGAVQGRKTVARALE